MEENPRSEINRILENRVPSRFVYAPNYWQWFRHQQNHGIVPDELAGCKNLTDLYKYLDVDIFSRNVYCDPEKYWFGGLCDESNDEFVMQENFSSDGKDRDINRVFSSGRRVLKEKQTYVFRESTLVQKKFLFSEYQENMDLITRFVSGRKWRFRKERFDEAEAGIGPAGMIIAGEFFSPLKMLHFTMGPVETVYFLMGYPGEADQLIRTHEEAQLKCMEEAVASGVRVVMSMDNLDTMFHSPDFVEKYSASYYTRASELCHRYGAKFMIHACGQQKDNLRLISSYGVDGLEGVAAPPLGDVLPEEALKETRAGFFITGGISAFETRDLKSREEIFRYVRSLFQRMKDYGNRFILSSSCNTSIDTSWDTIKNFRDAWLEYRDMI
jgi:uncharacterized protein (DUF1330 family)